MRSKSNGSARPGFWFCLVLVGAATLCGSGCAAARAHIYTGDWTPQNDCVLFVADGAGNFQCASRSIRATAKEDDLPIDVVTFEWSHGYARVIADQVDYRYARAQGKKLASAVMELRQCFPHLCIYLVGHSAGSSVVLAAAETASPGVIDGIILLAPSLSAFYDLRPALSHVNCCIDVFHSRRDWMYLGTATTLLGTAEGSWRRPAGIFGFRPILEHPEDAWLYSRLRQHPWTRADRDLGHSGDHYGGYQPDHLRVHVFPLLFAYPWLEELHTDR